MIGGLKKWDKIVNGEIRKGLTKEKYEKRTKRHGYSLARKNSFYALELKKKITESEKQFGYFLLEYGLTFAFQKGFFTPFHRIADFYIPVYKLIIEIDGGYHKETAGKDWYKDKTWLEKRHMKTIRIKNEEVPTMTKEKFDKLLQSLWA